MITLEDAKAADQLYKWCDDLEHSAAFASVVIPYIEEQRDVHERSGTDVSKSPETRAEHHRAYHLAKDLLTIVAKRKEEALSTLTQWQEQEGKSPAILPDRDNVTS